MAKIQVYRIHHCDEEFENDEIEWFDSWIEASRILQQRKAAGRMTVKTNGNEINEIDIRTTKKGIVRFLNIWANPTY